MKTRAGDLVLRCIDRRGAVRCRLDPRPVRVLRLVQGGLLYRRPNGHTAMLRAWVRLVPTWSYVVDTFTFIGPAVTDPTFYQLPRRRKTKRIH